MIITALLILLGVAVLGGGLWYFWQWWVSRWLPSPPVAEVFVRVCAAGQTFPTGLQVLLYLVEKGLLRGKEIEQEFKKAVEEAITSVLADPKMREKMEQAFKEALFQARDERGGPREILPDDVAEALAEGKGTEDLLGALLEAWGRDWKDTSDGLKKALIELFGVYLEESPFWVDLTARVANGQRNTPSIFVEIFAPPLASLENRLLESYNRFAILTGKGGVGKTTLVERLAERVVNGESRLGKEVKVLLAEYRQLTASAGSDAGALEDILIQLFDNLPEDAVLVIDEAAELLKDPMVREILKPRISRSGGIRLIFVMSDSEFTEADLLVKQHDPPFARRYQEVLVAEPTRSQTEQILFLRAKDFEQIHGVTVTEKAVKAATLLGSYKLDDIANPDGALQLLSAACALDGDGEVTVLRVVKAASQRFGTIPPIRLCGLVGAFLDEEVPLEWKVDVKARVDAIRTKLIGQDPAIDAVSAGATRFLAGLSVVEGCAGLYFFMGPTGVGKSKLASAIPGILGVGGPSSFYKLSGTDYTEAHTGSALIGTSAGYVGYDDPAIFAKPFVVIQVDEFEKMHPEVMKLFLQWLQEGVVRLKNGISVSWKGTFVVFTSNVGSREILALGSSPDPAKVKKVALTALEKSGILPELIGRILGGTVVCFNPLTRENLAAVVTASLADRYQGWIDSGWQVSVESAAREFIAETAYESVRFGARPVEGLIQQLLENPLSATYMSGALLRNKLVRVSLVGGKLMALQSGRNAVVLG